MSEKLLGTQIAEMMKGPVLKRIVGMIERYNIPCNCKGRERKLNEWHRRYKEITGETYIPKAERKEDDA